MTRGIEIGAEAVAQREPMTAAHMRAGTLGNTRLGRLGNLGCRFGRFAG